MDVIGEGLLPPVTRTTIEPPGMWRSVGGVRGKRLAARLVGKGAAAEFSAHEIWSNDYFIGMLAGRDLGKASPWQRFLENLPQEGVVEWVVHPGLPDKTLAGRDDYRAACSRA